MMLDTEVPRKPWFRRWKYIILIAMIGALLVLSLFPYLPRGPKSTNQMALDRTIDYFAIGYNSTTGLIPEVPGGHIYWLYSDNYLALLAISRYDPNNQSTLSFALALDAALGGYVATVPPNYLETSYSALNSTSASFNCHDNATLGWGTQAGGSSQGSAQVTLMTTYSGGDVSCQSQNYSDLLFLRAVLLQRLGNTTEALSAFRLASADFDGKGLVDISGPAPGSSGGYQTYKLALYVYAASCLGQASDQNLPTVEGLMFRQQDNSTGGFYTGYDSSLNHGSHSVNTETTALAALAIEALMNPTTRCG